MSDDGPINFKRQSKLPDRTAQASRGRHSQSPRPQLCHEGRGWARLPPSRPVGQITRFQQKKLNISFGICL